MADINKINQRRNNQWLIKSEKDLKKIMDDIIDYRRKNGKDKKDLSYNELIKASFRFQPLLEVLKKADIKRNRQNVR